jgi:serine/threonine protein phosphatase PrpC
VVGNLGDSRAILGTRDSNNRLMAVQLTVDLKPNVPSMDFSLLILFVL